MVQIKICGVTRAEDAAHAAAAGADFLGLNFWPRSKRYLEPSRAAAVAAAGKGARLVGIFVNPTVEELRAVLAVVALDVIQLHGDETHDEAAAFARLGLVVWKALAVRAASDLDDLHLWPTSALVLDAPTAGRGGSGETFDWTHAAAARTRYPAHPLVLAGGLHAENVAEAIGVAAPWGVDVASGVESAPGIKDPAKVTAFIAAVRGATVG